VEDEGETGSRRKKMLETGGRLNPTSRGGFLKDWAKGYSKGFRYILRLISGNEKIARGRPNSKNIKSQLVRKKHTKKRVTGG